MTNLLRFRTALFGAALLAAPAACHKDTTGSDSVHAAERVEDTTKDLRDEARDVVETAQDREKAASNARAVGEEMTDVAGEAADVKHAQFDFGYARLTRVGTLRAVHALALSQPQLINAFAHDVTLNQPERDLINEKLQIFMTRLDEAGNQIEALATVPAETWEQRHDDVNTAMDRLEDARDDAWDALHAAERAHARTSMR